MAHHVKLRPVRVHSYNGELRCDQVRIVGYRLVCSCGERSPVKPVAEQLRDWRREHLT